jgi:hypothetical protein
MVAQSGKTLIQRLAIVFHESRIAGKLREANNTTSTEIAVRDTTIRTGALLTWVYYTVSNTREDMKQKINNYKYRFGEMMSEETKYEYIKETVMVNITVGTGVAIIWPLYWMYRGVAWGFNKTI